MARFLLISCVRSVASPRGSALQNCRNRPSSPRGITSKGLFMGEDPDSCRAQAGCGETSRLTPAAPSAEGHNIAERRQKAEALRNSEETARVLLNAAPSAAFMIDTQGIVLAVNQIAATRFGVAAEAIVGRPISEFGPPALVESRRQKGIEVVRTGKTRRAKLYYLRKRVGKATRLKESEAVGAASAGQKAPAEAPAAQDQPQAQGEKASGKKE